MGPDEKEAIGIRTIRSRDNLRAHLAYLHAEARYLGKKMSSLGLLLCNEPARIEFEDAKYPALYQAAAPRIESAPDVFKAVEVDGNRIAALAQEIRDVSKEIEALEREIKEMRLQ